MNRPTKQTYHNDLVFQGLFYLPMMFLYLIGIIFEPGVFLLGLLVQFFVGVIQVLSGIFHSIRYEDKAHQNYLMIAIGYIVFLFLGSMGFGNIYFGGEKILMGLFLFVIPVGIATWYYRLTWQMYKKVGDLIDEEYTNQPFQEDILDDVLL